MQNRLNQASIVVLDRGGEQVASSLSSRALCIPFILHRISGVIGKIGLWYEVCQSPRRHVPKYPGSLRHPVAVGCSTEAQLLNFYCTGSKSGELSIPRLFQTGNGHYLLSPGIERNMSPAARNPRTGSLNAFEDTWHFAVKWHRVHICCLPPAASLGEMRFLCGSICHLINIF